MAVVDFPNLQVSCIQAGPQRYHFSVSQTGQGQPSGRFKRTAATLFGRVLEIQPGIAIGLNILRVGTFRDASAERFMVDWLNPAFVQRTSAEGRLLRGAGVKLLYDEGEWHVSFSLEPKAQVDDQLVANVNFEMLEPSLENLPELMRQCDQLYRSALDTLDHLMGEESVAAVR